MPPFKSKKTLPDAEASEMMMENESSEVSSDLKMPPKAKKPVQKKAKKQMGSVAEMVKKRKDKYGF